MSNAEHKRRTERIQETGGKLRGGTVGNVWEWGPQGWREDALMELSNEVFDTTMDHCETIVHYEQARQRDKERIEELTGALRELELFVRVLGLDSEPARQAAESARAILTTSTQ